MDFTIEELSMNAWPAIKTILYDGWVVRLAEGYANRANSINPIYPSRIKLEEKIASCDKLFARHNLPACYKLVDCEEHKGIDEKLESSGYRKINETSVQVCEIPRDLQSGFEGMVVSDEFSEGWIDSAIAYNKIDAKHAGTFRKIIGNIAEEKIVVHKEAGGEIAGCGYGVIGNGYAGVFDIVVREKFRNKGFGGEIVKTILSRAAGKGAKKTYLQAMLNNPPALHLYEKLGYRELYRYWYRKKAV